MTKLTNVSASWCHPASITGSTSDGTVSTWRKSPWQQRWVWHTDSCFAVLSSFSCCLMFHPQTTLTNTESLVLVLPFPKNNEPVCGHLVACSMLAKVSTEFQKRKLEFSFSYRLAFSALWASASTTVLMLTECLSTDTASQITSRQTRSHPAAKGGVGVSP